MIEGITLLADDAPKLVEPVASGGQLIGAFLVVTMGQLDWVACITQVHEVYTLNGATIFNVKTRDYSFTKHKGICHCGR